jgi:ABC-type antimicrobial peptide transport system permease subunit
MGIFLKLKLSNMKFTEMLILSISNLWQAKLRTILTTLGVVIGIGALVSMLSFGTGMQKNITDALEANDLFTSLTVTSAKINLEELSENTVAEIASQESKNAVPLNDSSLGIIRGIKDVMMAFPEIVFPGKAVVLGKTSNTNIRGIPEDMKDYTPFNDLLAGSFFTTDSAKSVIINVETLQNMGLIVEESGNKVELNEKMKAEGKIIVNPDSIIGKPIEIISAVLSIKSMPKNPLAALSLMNKNPLSEHSTTLTIAGITKRGTPFSRNQFDAGIFIPIKTLENIPRVGISSIWDFFKSNNQNNQYSSIHVRVKGFKELKPVRLELEKRGYHVFSIVDQLDEIRRSFLIMDSLLGAIGTIALIVAALGIINTMVMSILERTREIGIMKSIGASENEIKLIYIVEASVIGFLGAIFGLLLGWIVTLIANQVINSNLLPFGEKGIDVFYFPWWLIAGAFAFSILVSLLAGLYPAIRAARIDPVKALRHD